MTVLHTLRHTVRRPGPLAAAVACALAAVHVAPAAQQQPGTAFRTGTELVTVDVVVRDRSGAIVHGLTAGDFTVLEDGRPQRIETFAFHEIATDPRPATGVAEVFAGVQERLIAEVQQPAGTVAREAVSREWSQADFAGRRLVVLVFDISSMQPEHVQRAVDDARRYARERMAPSDIVAVVTIGSIVNVLTDFTDDPTRVDAALQVLAWSDGTADPPVDVSTAATDEADPAPGDGDETGFEEFNNDVRLRMLKTLADALAPIEQKKAIIYFTAGMPRAGEDNQVELRAAIDAANRANVALYPVDARGLQAVVPGGDASRPSGRGTGLFTGRSIQQQFTELAASQGTLTTLAADTGGRAFTDVNAFGEAFARVQSDLSAYYLLGYVSTNTRHDGRFRRIEVRARERALQLEARRGYYAPLDFAHMNRRDREAQLDQQLAAAVSSRDLPVVVGTGWFLQGRDRSGDRFYVPISMAVAGSAVPVAEAARTVSLDVRGVVVDERGRVVARIRDTLEVPASDGPTLAGRQVLYQSGVTLPPGRFAVKIVVRENATGLIGSFEAPILVPRLEDDTIRLSSIVLSTQLQPAAGTDRSGNPLVHDGLQVLPNLTRVVARSQSLYFYYEVYPALMEQAPHVRTSLTFYRGGLTVFETPVVERHAIDDSRRGAVVFRFEVPAGAFTPGTYTAQINVVDAAASQTAFPRVAFQVLDR